MKNEKLLLIAFTLALVICFISHLPFLFADADLCASPTSRGPWTDEGLYSSQIRNYINHGDFRISENDAFLKTPLFSAFLFFPLQIFGVHLAVARLAVITLFIIALVVFFFKKHFQSTLLVLVPTTLLFFPIHQYSHFSLAEICSISLILISVKFYIKYKTSEKKWSLPIAFLCLTGSVLFKLQFIYILILPIICLIVERFILAQTVPLKYFRLYLTWTISILLLLCFTLYFPFQGDFKIALKERGSFSFQNFSYLRFKTNVVLYFTTIKMICFFSCYVIAFFIALFYLYKNELTLEKRYLIIFSISWSFLEFLKLPIDYLPLRYIISMYFSMGLLLSVVIAETLKSQKENLKIFGSLAVIVLTITNLSAYATAYKNRTFVIDDTNKYLAQHDLKNYVIIGPWAPALTWESKSISLPIWRNFIQTNNPLSTYKPRVVISEYDEEDSNQAYSKQGINLSLYSDSIKSTYIAYWKVNIYWINYKKSYNASSYLNPSLGL